MASKRHIRRKQCQRKKRFSSRDEATMAQRSMAKRFQRSFKAYHCAFCGGFHIAKDHYYELRESKFGAA